MITAAIGDFVLELETATPLFSPDCVDKGTLAMLSVAEFSTGDKILDLGCGYGVVGIYAAKLVGEANVVMCDINKKAVETAAKNAVKNGVGGIRVICSDGFVGLDESEFTAILSNPPYHADFKVPKHFIEKGFNRLVVGGKMYMVTKRLDWYKNKLAAIFGGVKVCEINGYYVFCAEKRKSAYANVKKAGKKHGGNKLGKQL